MIDTKSAILLSGTKSMTTEAPLVGIAAAEEVVEQIVEMRKSEQDERLRKK